MLNNKGRSKIIALGNATRKLVPLHNMANIAQDFQKVGIQVKYVRDDSYVSYLEWDEYHDQPVIALYKGLSHAEMNFALLHEFSHLLIEYKWHPGIKPHTTNEYLLNIENKVCGCDMFQDADSQNKLNEFAISYLIPKDDIQSALQGGELDYLELVGGLSRKFSVPFSMVKLRLNLYLAIE